MKYFKRWLCILLATVIFATTAYSEELPVYASNNVVTEQPQESENSSGGSVEETPVEEEAEEETDGLDADGDGGNEVVPNVTEDPKENEATNEQEEAAEPSIEEEDQDAFISNAQKDRPYQNYVYGDPDYSGNFVIETLEDGSEVMEMYEDDLNAIIAMAEEGMDLSRFFYGTIYEHFTLDELYAMREEEYTFLDISMLYATGTQELPSWLAAAFTQGGNGARKARRKNTRAGSLASTGVQHISGGALGVNEVLGGGLSHGAVVKLTTTAGAAFCAKYGGSYTTGLQYESASYSDVITPAGAPLTAEQDEVIRAIVACYLKTTDQSDGAYAGAQCLIWYIINNPGAAKNYYYETAWNGGMSVVAGKIAGGNPALTYSIRAFMRSAQIFLEALQEGLITLEDISRFFEPDNYPGQAPNIYYWKPIGNDRAQWILTWDIGPGGITAQNLEIPTVDNFYREKEAVTTYGVDIVKESIITNELLEGISFEVVESEASGSDLTYGFITGEYADGSDYENAVTESGSFGNVQTVTDPVPYMDDDILPSGGMHRTTITTDENGHAQTAFVHSHTFKEYYSICKNADGAEISFDTYRAIWESTLQKAGLSAGAPVEVRYLGATQMMTLGQIKDIYEKQQVVYTQTEDEAMSTINDLYDKYLNRTYTYTVTELDTYTREADRDSNEKELFKVSLPKEGYRKDVGDATTIGPYVDVLANGETMITGGGNDQDADTEELHVTNEPWHNQIFINKTDLETNSQILYDTEFEIYEYYQYKVNLEPANKKLYPGQLLNAFLNKQGGKLNPANIESAKITVLDKDVEVESFPLDTARLSEAIKDPTSYGVDFTTTYSDDFVIRLTITIDAAKDKAALSRDVIRNAALIPGGTCSCEDDCRGEDCPVCRIDPSCCNLSGGSGTMQVLEGSGTERTLAVTSSVGTEDGELRFVTADGLTYVTTTILPESVGEESAAGKTLYTCQETGTVYKSTDGAALHVGAVNGTEVLTFTYREPVEGIYLFSRDGENDRIIGGEHDYVLFEMSGTEAYLYYAPGGTLKSGTYTQDMDLQVSANDIHTKNIDRNVSTNPDDYTTWGRENYEIVRVTSEIARQMKWPDTTIGMYTVHRKSMTDQYCGTTFGNHHDESDKNIKWGYYEYGTLYYTQANLGRFAIVEKTAPADAPATGYLGNYSDRDYTKLDGESSKKNNEGLPYATKDQMSTIKMVHYLTLCKDTNQYASYMLIDGFKEYEDQHYTNFAKTITDDRGCEVETEDGYDAHYYDQSSLVNTIALERYELEDAKEDVLNGYWDQWFSNYLSRRSGLTVLRDSKKTDAFMALKGAVEVLHHYVGTTINLDSFDDNDAAQSDIAYDGTYTDTTINYSSYAGERAEGLNKREGFHKGEYLQAGVVIYDNGEMEKQARYMHTEPDITREEGYAFLDEREYGYIRFTKYDMDAERYVTGGLDEGYEAGSDHADADLDGAVYSLYVDESNTFTVDYMEGEKEGRLFWAQPLKSGGWRIIYDANNNSADGFTDEGNEYEDYPHAYVAKDGFLYLDYYDTEEEGIRVEENTAIYSGIQHPDGQYGGEKHNGFFAVFEEQQVFLDLNGDGYGDTWTLEDVTLYAGAKAASAVIRDGELAINGMYLGTYYLAEEIRDAITIHSTDNNDHEQAQNRFLSFAAGYTADTDESGNPTKYMFRFPYVGQDRDGISYAPEQDYVHKDTSQVSNQLAVKGSAQFRKTTSNGESSSSNNTTGEPLEGAGFKVYLLSELSFIKDGTVKPAYTEIDGHELVEKNALTKLFDESGNMVGYEFTKGYLREQNLYAYFEEKYPEGYNLEDVNRILYIKDRGYYYAIDILDAYKDRFYDNFTRKWDFTGEEQAVVRIYEEDAEEIERINGDYAYVENHLNSGSPCEFYGINGLSKGWEPTGVKNEYRLAEIFSNHYGSIRLPELAFGAYILVETTTPTDVFSADPVFFSITDSTPSINRGKTVEISDAPIVTSLVLVKRDAQTGQDIKKAGTSYRIWDYKNNGYVKKYIRGENGALSMVAQQIFKTDNEGRINAVANLECGRYRMEELYGPRGYHNAYWDYGNATKEERLGGIGEDGGVSTLDNLFQRYFGAKDFEVTTDRLYKASGIVSSDNLDYIYIGEAYYNDEIRGKITITKTGEVLVGYENTDDIEYADEYTQTSDKDFKYSKSMMRERAVFRSIKDYYDLGTDAIETRKVTLPDLKVSAVRPVAYLAVDGAGMGIAAIYLDDEGQMATLNGGKVYQEGVRRRKDKEESYYPGALVVCPEGLYVYSLEKADRFFAVYKTFNDTKGDYAYYDAAGEEITDERILERLKPGAEITKTDGKVEYASKADVKEIRTEDGYLMIAYAYSVDIYEGATLEKAENQYIYTIAGHDTDTSYLVTDTDGVLTTNDHGILKRNANGTVTIVYDEAIYDPDINYHYTISLSDGSEIKGKLVTSGVYLLEDGSVARSRKEGGFSFEKPDGTVSTDEKALMRTSAENTGETFDFVYEERPLAGATYQIKAAEDIRTPDGTEENYWFRKGDTVATVTTANDGEVVSFAPAYNQGGNYDSTYYYGNSGGSHNSLTKSNPYDSGSFTTSGGIINRYVTDRMEELDVSLFGIPAFTDDTVYANTYYREETLPIFRRIHRDGVSADVEATDYQSRLEADGGLSSEGCEVLTETPDGFYVSRSSVMEYKDAVLEEEGDQYLLVCKGRSGEDMDIEIRESESIYEIVECLDESLPWTPGDYVRKTASGYQIMHTDVCEKGVHQGSTVLGAYDLGYTTIEYYRNAVLFDNGNGMWTLYDENKNKIAKVKSGILTTEAGGIVEKTDDGYRIYYEKGERITANSYVVPELTVKGAVLTIKDQEYELSWNTQSKSFQTSNHTEVLLSTDYKSVTVITNGQELSYQAFDLLVEYELHYATKEDIVTIEKDGSLGMVSLYLPLGTYTVEEVGTPYGFLLSEQVQTVELSPADQVKEVVFNTSGESGNFTNKTMNVWKDKGLAWFVGGLNTIGEKLKRLADSNFFTWGTYGDAETAFFGDREGFLNFFDLRVRAWSNENVPEPIPGDGYVAISKMDITTLQELPGASLLVTDGEGAIVDAWVSTERPHKIRGLKDGTYTLTEKTAPDGYKNTESITFQVRDGRTEGTVIMYNAPINSPILISKQSITGKGELPGASLVLTDASGKTVDAWISGKEPRTIENLPDGTYTLTEIAAPGGYGKAESITFEVRDSAVLGGTVVMYDAPDDGRLYISKKDLAGKEELPGARLILLDETERVVESWVSTDEPHVIEGLLDGTYTLVEYTAPDGYLKAESITIRIENGRPSDGAAVMYDRTDLAPDEPEDDRHEESKEHQWNLGVGIYKKDADTKELLKGAKFGLYSSNDIYNVDGKLIVPKDKLLAVATTDVNGFANFAVDIALMSKDLDEDRADHETIYRKTITYVYDEIKAVTDEIYEIKAEGAGSIRLKRNADGTFCTETGEPCEINLEEKTITYTVNQSIDGNTAVNTGRFYIRELTPPEGYLYDDTAYEVKFTYDDAYTMYIPVYAEHKNEPVKAALNKMDLAGTKEVPGAVMAVYEIKDVQKKDADGVISHDADNLILIDKWTTTDESHEVTRLKLSNTQWPLLANQTERETIYVFRELVPANGYVRASDIEFKVYQTSSGGAWVDGETKRPFGYEVMARSRMGKEDYLSGAILSPSVHADFSHLKNPKEGGTWDYAAVLEGTPLIRWMLVNGTLVLFISDEANKASIEKILNEEDFSNLSFDKVCLEFAGNTFDVDFYKDKQVKKRPEDAYPHYDQIWQSLSGIRITMYDDITKLAFEKQDLVTGADVIGAQLEIRDKDGRLIDSWTTSADQNGNAVPHKLEGVLIVGEEYTLIEKTAPTKDGYVKSNSVRFRVEDDGSVNRVVMQDDFTKLEISKADAVSAKEVDGALLEIWSVNKDGKKEQLIERWTTGTDGYDKDGNPNRHYMEYLPVGSYVLVEAAAPEGYLLAEDLPFTVSETGIVQKVRMLDASSALKVYKYRTGTTEFVPGASIRIYAVPEEYVKYLSDRFWVETDAAVIGAGTAEADTATIGEPKADREDLMNYLTGIKAENAEHRKDYETRLTLSYGISAENLEGVPEFSGRLPNAVSLNAENLSVDFAAMDGDMEAFTYRFEESREGGILKVSFNEEYLRLKDLDSIRFYVSFDAVIDSSALRANGSLTVPFTENHRLVITKEEIREIESSLTTPAVTIRLTDKDLAAEVKTRDGAVRITGLKPGWYVALEVKAPSGYILDKTPQAFYLGTGQTELALTFYNEAVVSPKPQGGGSHEGGGGDRPEKPIIGKLLLRFGTGFMWNNVRTEDSGEEGSSVLLTIEEGRTFPIWFLAFPLMLIGAGCAAIMRRRKKRKQN